MPRKPKRRAPRQPAARSPRAARPEPIHLRPILAEFGVTIVPTSRRRRPGETHARGMLIEIMTDHGEDHLRLVLRCLREPARNREAMWSETFAALSDVLASEPSWKAHPAALLHAMAAIDLDALRLEAVELRPWPVRETLRAWLFDDVERLMPIALVRVREAPAELEAPEMIAA